MSVKDIHNTKPRPCAGHALARKSTRIGPRFTPDLPSPKLSDKIEHLHNGRQAGNETTRTQNRG